jgi:hypothetical protein
MKKIRLVVLSFLKKTSIVVKIPEKFPWKLFKSGSSINFLGFKLVFPDGNKSKLNRSKSTKATSNYINAEPQKVSSYLYNSPYLLVQNRLLESLKSRIKTQLNLRYSYLPLNTMIVRLNSILINFLNYFNITFTITKQLLPLNNLLHKLFYKYLLYKYSSKPKIYSFIQKTFRVKKHFVIGNLVLLKVGDVKSSYLVDFMCITPGNDFSKNNTYWGIKS